MLLERIPSTSFPQNTEAEKRQLVINGTSLQGKVNHTWKGESKAHLLYQINNLRKDKAGNALEDYLTASSAKCQLSKLKTSNLSDWDNELTISYELSQTDAVTEFGDELYVDVDFRKEFEHFQLDTAERHHDFVFDYKMHLQHETEITIPANYTLKQVPPSVSIDRPQYAFQTNFKNVGGALVYTKEIILKQVTLPKEAFAQWNSDIAMLKKAYFEQLILIKKKG